jgi:small subunit ribosomal protein S16
LAAASGRPSRILDPSARYTPLVPHQRSPTEGLFVAVKIRLARHGSNKNPIYRVVVADSRVPRDGRTLEEIGRYNPQMQPSLVEIDADRAREWIARGAQPTDTVRKLLKIAGV